MAKHPAAFINEIADEGTRDEAILHLQETWDELCETKSQLHKFQRKFEIQEEYATSRLCVAHRGHWSRDRCVICELEATVSRLETSEIELGVCRYAIQEALHCIEAGKTPNRGNLAAALDSDVERSDRYGVHECYDSETGERIEPPKEVQDAVDKAAERALEEERGC